MSSAGQMISRNGVAVDVIRPTEVVDGFGASKTFWFAHLSGVTMWPQPKSGSEFMQYEGVGTDDFVTFYALVGENVGAKDRIVWDGSQWDVMNVRAPGAFGASRGVSHQVIDARRVREAALLKDTAVAFRVTYTPPEAATVRIAVTNGLMTIEVTANDITSSWAGDAETLTPTGTISTLIAAINATDFAVIGADGDLLAVNADLIVESITEGPATADGGAPVRVFINV